ncbi:MAG: hypothetical protein KA270_01040 [Saprospiraceae bacterium]|nr:hypothetical protein [Saprospiraceae bacterium]MBP6565715.1 hypothetical protein [Saprospiraceae bacterium]
MRSFKTFQSSCKNVPASISRAMMIMFLLVSTHMFINAQATLSLQGILKKANGIALEDDTYPITFKIYVVDSTQVKWMETQPEVEVISGIYSVILGKVTPLNLPFDKDYELGISIGSQEMRPRVRLTSAPYALALRGSSNQFPSAGQVLADEIKVAQGVLASGGAPGTNGVDKNGYAFTGNNGDNDSGLFSTADGKASLYSNNVEILSVTPGMATVIGDLKTNNLDINNNGTVKYNGISDWRLADVDDFSSSHDGWKQYNNMTSGTTYSFSEFPCLCNFGTFIGNVLEPSLNTLVLKKEYDIPGSWTQMKVKFKYIYVDSWDLVDQDRSYAAFASNASGGNVKLGWSALGQVNQSPYGSDFAGNSTYYDYELDVEMTGRRNSNDSKFWVYIGALLNQTTLESYAIGPVEIWVK